MRKQLLLSTAALLAGMTLASAQHMQGAQSPGSSPAQERQQSTQGRSGQAQPSTQEQGKQGQPQRSESRSQRDQTTGQASQSEQGRQGQREQGTGRREQNATQPSRNEQKSTTGQSQRDQGREATQPSRSDQTQGQTQHPQQGQASQPQRSQPQAQQGSQTRQGQSPQSQPQQGQAQQGQQGFTSGQSSGGAQTQAGGNVNLTAEQRARIRETVLARSDVPRVNNANFALSVGTVVPTTVRVVEVPETLIEIYPQWRGDEYFVVRDEIIIVDHGHRIVAVLPVESSSMHSSAAMPGPGSSAGLNLGRDEIRQVQIMLNQKGFSIGEPDGVFGERTRAALIQFQQRQGLQASGHIDHQTMTALGVSGQQGQQNQPSSSGQAGTNMNRPGANQGTTAGQQGNPSGQPSTAGQGGDRMQQPAANPAPANQGSGAGSSGSSTQQTPQNANPNSSGGANTPQRQIR